MKNIKLVIFLLTILLLVLIFYLTYNKSFNYVAIGDELTLGKNNFNKNEIGFSNLFQGFLLNNNLIKSYNNMYSKDNLKIEDVLKEIHSNTKRENINQIIVNADIITLSLGMTELKELASNSNMNYIEKNNFIIEIYNNYLKLIEKIRKLNDCEIYVIGIYQLKGSTYLTNELNQLLKKLEKIKNTYYIDILDDFNKYSYYMPTNTYPTVEGYNYISNKIIKRFTKNKLYLRF